MAARAKRVRRRPCKTLGELRPDFRLGPLKKAFRIFEAEPGWLRGYAALYSAEPPGSGARLVPWLRQVMLPHQGPAIAEDGQTQTPTVGLYQRSPQTVSATSPIPKRPYHLHENTPPTAQRRVPARPGNNRRRSRVSTWRLQVERARQRARLERQARTDTTLARLGITRTVRRTIPRTIVGTGRTARFGRDHGASGGELEA
jgi:hypothetical protein